ncbi:A/G-specific adenine glycosylase [bacterium]|nr:MAG: A/G-specific adenine glycosylase [bacterium]
MGAIVSQPSAPAAGLHEPLLAWYDEHKRDLPWRRTRDPYAIWASEIMAQQTQVGTVIPYWERWLARFPTVEALASADEADALSMWQGLGYYRRARFFLSGARWVVSHGMPKTAEGWKKVPGVGAYTAGAIASIAFDDPAPLVDGNVERVYARLEDDPAEGAALHRNAWAWAQEQMYEERPGDWNQALMELGATVCIPRMPLCHQCPVADRCLALARNTHFLRPTPAKRPDTVVMRQAVWVPMFEGRYGMRQVPKGEWWEGMWEFPRAPLEDEASLEPLVGTGWRQDAGVVRHTVTHHRIEIRVSLVRCEEASPDLEWFDESELVALPIPTPQRRALAKTKAL